MSFLATLLANPEQGHHVVNELPFPTFVYGLIAFVLLSALALITFAFRDVAHRHAEKAEAYAREHGVQKPGH